MSKFKVGDWVKCTDPVDILYGKTLLIAGVSILPLRYKLKENGTNTVWWCAAQSMSSFVLTPAPDMKTESKTEGVKHDSGKRQWWFMWQFLPELEQVVDILDYGNKKYPADDGSNWRKVDNAKNRYTSAAMRHWSAWLGGEKVDAETGKSHLAHMITNLLFLMWFERKAND